MLAHVYVLTFIVFPGVTNLATLTIMETNGPWFQIFWITLFNVSDTIGRYIGGQPCAYVSRRCLNLLCWLRLLPMSVIFVYAYVGRD